MPAASVTLVVFLGLCALEMRATSHNLGLPWNGIGAVPGVRDRTAKAPMRYRVLVPWLLRLAPVRWQALGYFLVKWAIMALAVLAARPLVGVLGMTVLALLMAVTFEYDYWDGYAELLGVALVLSGEPGAVLLGAALWALSRETVWLAPILAFAGSGAILGAVALVGPLVWCLVRLRQGRAEMYCHRWTLRTYNAADIRAMRERVDVGLIVSFAWCLAVLVVVLWADLPPVLDRTRALALVWIVAGWVLGRARETRVFLPSALWLAGGLYGG